MPSAILLSVQARCLDSAAVVAASIPASVVDSISTAGLVFALSGPKKTNEGRCKEKNGTEESEGDGCLEFAALVAMDRMDVLPVEDSSAAATNELKRGHVSIGSHWHCFV